MTVKKEYDVGDPVWIFGINRSSNKLTKGKVVQKMEIPGYMGIHYVVAIKTPIEDLLEVRTWESISQDEEGPIGLFRGVKNLENVGKYLSTMGFSDSNEDQDIDPTADEIRAALEKSIDKSQHPPLILKEVKTKNRRKFGRKRI